MKLKPRQMIIMALLIAMAIILRRILTLHFPIGIINFSGFPIILAGLLYGPASGGIVGAVSDILGYPLFPEGPYSPLFTITSALTGIIPAFIVMKLKRKETASMWMLVLAILVGQMITKVLLVPFFLQLQFGIPFVWKSPTNFIVEIIHTPMYALLAQPVLMIYGDLYPQEAILSRMSPQWSRH